MRLKTFLRKLRRRQDPPPFAYWATMRRSSLALFYGGVFALFCSLGFIVSQMEPSRQNPLHVGLNVLISGGTAVGYAWMAVSRKWVYLPVVLLVQLGGSTLLGRAFANTEILVAPHSILHSQLRVLGAFAIVFLSAGYGLFIAFLTREGTRYFRMQTEMELAGEIHRTLVPTVNTRINGFELYGASVPSGLVGGDIVDLIEHEDGWIGYVADVSGHGVSAGVLMAMFKTAVHTRFSGVTSLASLLADVNQALFPLKTQNRFVTAGFLGYRQDGCFSASLAGHPPLLHYCARLGTVSEIHSQSLPLGIGRTETFGEDPLSYGSGDVFALLTDGVTEVFDSGGQELSVEQIKSTLQKHAHEPLPRLFERLREVSLSFGPQTDDQTVLLLRRLNGAPVDGSGN